MRYWCCLMLMSLWLGSVNAQDRKLERFILSNAAVSESRAPLYIAKDLGLFEKYGLNVDIVAIRGSAISTAALLAGEIQMALAGSQTAITAAARGAPIVLVASVGPTENVIVARPPIATAAQLRGKVIGIGGFGVADYFIVRRIMPRFGLTPDKDFSYLPTGFTSSFERINVMLAGKFDATLASRNNVTRADVYQKKVNIVPGTEEQGSGGEFYTTRELLKSRGSQIRALFRAFSEAVRIGREHVRCLTGRFAAMQKKIIRGCSTPIMRIIIFSGQSLTTPIRLSVCWMPISVTRAPTCPSLRAAKPRSSSTWYRSGIWRKKDFSPGRSERWVGLLTVTVR